MQKCMHLEMCDRVTDYPAQPIAIVLTDCPVNKLNRHTVLYDKALISTVPHS